MDPTVDCFTIKSNNETLQTISESYHSGTKNFSGKSSKVLKFVYLQILAFLLPTHNNIFTFTSQPTDLLKLRYFRYRLTSLAREFYHF